MFNISDVFIDPLSSAGAVRGVVCGGVVEEEEPLTFNRIISNKVYRLRQLLSSLTTPGRAAAIGAGWGLPPEAHSSRQQQAPL